MTKTLEPKETLSDIDKSRTKSRFLVGAAQITGATLLTIITGGVATPMFGSIGGSLLVSTLSNKSIDKRLLKERELLNPYVEEDVKRLFKAGKVKVNKQVAEAYEKVIANSKQSCEEWRTAMLESFEKLKDGSADTNTNSLNALASDLLTAMERLKEGR